MPSPREMEIRALVHKACDGDQYKIGMINIMWNMYCESDFAQMRIEQEFRQNKVATKQYYTIGTILYDKVILFFTPRVLRDALKADRARPFMCDDRSGGVAFWGQAFGKVMCEAQDAFARIPLCFANYMRAGMRAIFVVVETHNLCPPGPSKLDGLKRFVNDKLTGNKIYPTMVWGDDGPLNNLMFQTTRQQAADGTELIKWKPQESVKDLIDVGIVNKDFGLGSDLYGRQLQDGEKAEKIGFPTNSNRMKGRMLLEKYVGLTSMRAPLGPYHFRCFWKSIFLRVVTGKGWGKFRVEGPQEDRGELVNEDEVVDWLYQCIDEILACLQPHVPMAEKGKLAKADIKRIRSAHPVVPAEYMKKVAAPVPPPAPLGPSDIKASVLASRMYGAANLHLHMKDFQDLRDGKLPLNVVHTAQDGTKFKAVRCTKGTPDNPTTYTIVPVR